MEGSCPPGDGSPKKVAEQQGRIGVNARGARETISRGVMRAFEGLKVLDFTWVAIGPMATRYLADHGATVVKVESEHRVETLRRGHPLKDNTPGVNRSGYFANYNANKYSLTLNMTHPRAMEVARRLVAWADVVTENFTPGTIERWGLGYDDLKKIRPDIILFSASMLGRGGPQESQPGFGGVLASLAGLVELTGWPDRSPVTPYGAYTDFFIPRFAIAAIGAALDYRRRTGRGQHLDMSQLETALQFIAPALLDYTVNGVERTRQGNRSPYAAPHAIYPCTGEDRWCAVAVGSDQQWKAMCRVMGEPPWCLEERFATVLGRKENEKELDERIARWTADYGARELMRMLQEAGVPAGEVNRCEELFSDPQLTHRGHFVYMDHAELGRHSFDGVEFTMPASPARFERPAPLLGEHNEFVLRELLKMGDDEIAELVTEGVLE